jgi:long-chain acyl-CoA synthetase
MFELICYKYAKRTALIFGRRKITYQNLESRISKLAFKLRELGVKKSDRVAIWMPNCPEFVNAFFAVLKLGAIVVPINTMFKREEAKFIVEDSDAKVLFCSIDKVDDCENILSRLQSLEQVVSFPAPHRESVVCDFRKFIKHSDELSTETKVEEDDIAQIIYTSGTTGRPKGACLSHRNLLSNIKGCSRAIKFSKKDRVICVLPLFHSFASTVCMLLPIYNGASVVIMRAVRPFKRVLRAIFKHRVTIFAGVPSFYNILGEAKVSWLKLFFSWFMNPIRLYISGAAALPFPVWQKFEKKFKRPLIQGYGLTEASPVVSLNPLKGKKPDSIGLPLPSVSLKVVDKKGAELPCGEVGELLVKGPNVMVGYLNSGRETQNALKNGWLYTGDLAKIDKDGFAYIMGRSKDMINVRGLNVYPREIEDLLYRHHQIKEAAVVGVCHRHRGEVPIAFIVKEGQVNEREIIKYLRGNLASYKVPLRIIVKDSLPKNPTGKILKRQLRDEVSDIFASH